MITLHVPASFGTPLAVYLFNVAVASVLVCAVALAAERLLRRGPLPLRHAVLLCGLSVATVSPLAVGLIQGMRCSLIGVTANSVGAMVAPHEVDGSLIAVDSGPGQGGGDHTAPVGQDVTQAAAGRVASAADRGPEARGESDRGQRDSASSSTVAIGNNAWHLSHVLFLAAIGSSLAWLAGSGYQLLRLLRGAAYVRRFLASVQPIDDEEIHRLASWSASQLGLARCPAVGQSPAIEAPLSLGVRRPRVVLPAMAVAEWPDEQWRTLLLHEMAHIGRRDLLVGLLERVALVVCWWNPLLHRVTATIDLLREEICDDLVTAHAPQSKDYVALIVELASRAFEPRLAGVALGAAEGSPSELAQRVHRLLDPNRRLVTRLSGRMLAAGTAFGFVLVLGLAATSVHLASARAADAAPEAEKKDTEAAATPPVQPDDSHSKTVRIVNSAGEPVAGATVVPWAIRDMRGSHGSWTTKGQGASEPPKLLSDADGKVTIHFPRFSNAAEKILPKELTCAVEHPDYASTVYNDVSVAEGELQIVATIVVKAGALVELTAMSGDRALPPEQVYALWSSPTFFQGTGKRGKVNAAGRLELPRLPAGAELLRLAYFPVEGPSLFSDVESLELVDGEHYELRIDMKPAISVEGQLDKSVPRPVKNGWVVAEVIERPENGHTLDWRVTVPITAEGGFTLPAMPRGNLQVIAICDGYMAESGEVPDFVPEAQKFASAFSRPQVFALVEEKNEITLVMTPTAECLIHVVGPDERPLAGAMCSFWPNVAWWNGGSQIYGSPKYSTYELLIGEPAILKDLMLKNQSYIATTDAEGNALIKNIPPREHAFVVLDDRFEVPLNEHKQRHVQVELKAGEQTKVEVELQPKGQEFEGAE